MALTVNILRSAVPGDRHEQLLDLIADNRYGPGGYQITPAMCGLSHIDSLAINAMASGLLWQYDPVTSYLSAWKVTAAGLVECAKADVTPSMVVRAIARGTS